MASKKTTEEVQEVKEEKNEKDLLKALADRVDKLEARNKELEAQVKPITKAELDERSKKFEEKTSVYLKMDKGIMKEDVFVAVNGERVLIQRAKNVKVAKKFARTIQLADRQRAEAITLIGAETERYDKASQILGL